MITETMSNRERMFRAFRHREADRVPAVIHARGEVQRALAGYYGCASYREVLRLLGADAYAGMMFDVSFPGFQERADRMLQTDAPGAGKRYVFHDERTFEDGWGVVRRLGRDGKYLEWVTGPLVDADEPEELPVWDALDEFSMHYQYGGVHEVGGTDDLASAFRALKEQDLVIKANITQPYKTAWQLRGMENVLADYLINRDFLERLYDRIFAVAGEILRRCTAAGADVIGFEGDIAMQDRVIMGPEPWRAVDKPRLAALLASCREINPEVVTFIHTDGDASAIMPDLIEVGFDVIDPIQPECMDPVEMKRLYGDRITLHGCGSLQKTLPFGTTEDCRREVRELIDGCGRGGGLVLRVSNNIGFDVPVENVAAWYEEARDYRPAFLS